MYFNAHARDVTNAHARDFTVLSKEFLGATLYPAFSFTKGIPLLRLSPETSAECVYKE